MLVRAITTAAGRFNFAAGELVDIEQESDVVELESVGAVQRVSEDEPKADSEPSEPSDRPGGRTKASRSRGE